METNLTNSTPFNSISSTSSWTLTDNDNMGLNSNPKTTSSQQQSIEADSITQRGQCHPTTSQSMSNDGTTGLSNKPPFSINLQSFPFPPNLIPSMIDPSNAANMILSAYSMTALNQQQNNNDIVNDLGIKGQPFCCNTLISSVYNEPLRNTVVSGSIRPESKTLTNGFDHLPADSSAKPPLDLNLLDACRTAVLGPNNSLTMDQFNPLMGSQNQINSNQSSALPYTITNNGRIKPINDKQRTAKTVNGNNTKLSPPEKQKVRSHEDYCNICQKHFCDKYYLRRHKADVHGIYTEPYSHERRRDNRSRQESKRHLNVSTSGAIGHFNTSQCDAKRFRLNTSGNIGSLDQQLRNKRNSIVVNDSSKQLPSLPSALPFLSSTVGNSNNQSPINQSELDAMLSAHRYLMAIASGQLPSVGQPDKVDRPESEQLSQPGETDAKDDLRGVKCEHCSKVFCNQYFLDLHKTNQHQEGVDAAQSVNESSKQQSIDEQMNGDFNFQSGDLTQSNDEGNGIDTFKHSMVAAKLADRVKCEFCNKELCNKYFLRTHKIRVHGISPENVGGPPMRNPPPLQRYEMSNYPLPNSSPVPESEECVPSNHQSSNQTINWFQQPDEICIDKPIGNELPNESNMAIVNSNKIPNNGLPQQLQSQAICPLCGVEMEHRMFLVSHLSLVHKLNPTDPSFFMHMLAIPPTSSSSPRVRSPTSLQHFKSEATCTVDRPINDAMNRISNDLEKGKQVHSEEEQLHVEALSSIDKQDNSMLVPSYKQQQPIEQQSQALPNTSSSDRQQLYPSVSPGILRWQSQTILPSSLSIHQPTNSTGTNSVVVQPDTSLPTTSNNIQPMISNQSGSSPLDLMTLAALASVNATTTTSGNPPNDQSIDDLVSFSGPNPNNLQAAALWAAAANKFAANINNSGRMNGSTSSLSTAPRKSPNQMRVYCELCNKWICNKYFLRTHRANRHGIGVDSIVNEESSNRPLDLGRSGNAEFDNLTGYQSAPIASGDNNNNSTESIPSNHNQQQLMMMAAAMSMQKANGDQPNPQLSFLYDQMIKYWSLQSDPMLTHGILAQKETSPTSEVRDAEEGCPDHSLVNQDKEDLVHGINNVDTTIASESKITSEQPLDLSRKNPQTVAKTKPIASVRSWYRRPGYRRSSLGLTSMGGQPFTKHYSYYHQQRRAVVQHRFLHHHQPHRKSVKVTTSTTHTKVEHNSSPPMTSSKGDQSITHGFKIDQLSSSSNALHSPISPSLIVTPTSLVPSSLTKITSPLSNLTHLQSTAVEPLALNLSESTPTASNNPNKFRTESHHPYLIDEDDDALVSTTHPGSQSHSHQSTSPNSFSITPPESSIGCSDPVSSPPHSTTAKSSTISSTDDLQSRHRPQQAVAVSGTPNPSQHSHQLYSSINSYTETLSSI